MWRGCVLGRQAVQPEESMQRRGEEMVKETTGSLHIRTSGPSTAQKRGSFQSYIYQTFTNRSAMQIFKIIYTLIHQGRHAAMFPLNDDTCIKTKNILLLTSSLPCLQQLRNQNMGGGESSMLYRIRFYGPVF